MTKTKANKANRVERCKKALGPCAGCGQDIKKGDPYVHWKPGGAARQVRCSKPECYPELAHVDEYPVRLETRGPVASDEARSNTGLEALASMLLNPVMFTKNANWYAAHECGVMGGVRVAGAASDVVGKPNMHGLISYAPVLIPHAWRGRALAFVVEHEAHDQAARYALHLSYGCADPAQVKIIITRPIEGKANKRLRLTFAMDPSHLVGGELARFSLKIVRHTDYPLFVYGAWLELGS